MIPFMTEEIYQNLVCSIDKDVPKSIHLCDYPVSDAKLIDKELEKNMEESLEIVVLGRAARNEANIKNRQPVASMVVKADSDLSEYFEAIIREELNVKNVEFRDDVSDLTSYTFKPQLRTVGPKYGKLLGGIQKYLASMDGTKAMNDLNTDGAIKFDVNGSPVELTKEDLLIDVSQKEGFVTEADQYVTVVLDTNLTPELIEEGFVAEVISKVQTMRKDSGFEVMDRINVTITGNGKLAEVVKKNENAISTKVLADSISFDGSCENSKEWNINGEDVTIGVKKINS